MKEWILAHPEALGLEGVVRRHEEYRFVSGDMVDALFELRGNRSVVVEIETDNPFPGCHQALKYCVLRCAELGLPIASDAVSAFVVAWNSTPAVAKFCEKYGIEFLQKSL